MNPNWQTVYQPRWFNTMKTKLNLLWDNWSSNFVPTQKIAFNKFDFGFSPLKLVAIHTLLKKSG